MDKPARPATILIADDHPIFRYGLRRFLESQSDWKLVGEAADGAEAVSLCQKLKPDILLLDLAMPRLHGMEALRELAGSAQPVRIIVLTASIEAEQLVEALQLGARGIVLKEAASELLLDGIRAVLAGQYWIGREKVTDLVHGLRSLVPPPRRDAPSRNYGLTAREMEIVSAITLGNTNKDIARLLSISEDTVKHHLTSVFNKLGVSTRLELALFALHKGLVRNP